MRPRGTAGGSTGVRVSIIVAFLVLPGIPGAVAGGDEVVRVLVTGNPPRIAIASVWLRVDPITDVMVIPAREHGEWTPPEIQRYVRLYFPRTYDELLAYEFMILASIEVWMFTTHQQRMLYDGIVDGIGGLQTRSVMSTHTAISIPWAESVLSDAFPNDADAVVSVGYTGLQPLGGRVVFNRHPAVPAVFTPYGDLPGLPRSFPGYYTLLTIPREGVVVASYSIGPYPHGYPGAYPDPEFEAPGWIPHAMYWEHGKGVTWTFQDNFGFPFWSTEHNPYAPDMLLGLVIFSTGRTLPEDVAQVHMLRAKFLYHDRASGLVHLLLDFIDRFGARTDEVLEGLDMIAGKVSEGKRLYRMQSYDEASALMDEALSDMDAMGERAMRLKESALVWVHLIQWLVVTGVSLAAGVSVWTLMIRRRLYREVAVTRMR